MMYVIMDGFDLGIGIIFPFVPTRSNRDTMINTIAPVWDGNETWLVLGGAGLLAAFPTAYSIILSALYLPLVFMLVGLIWRGVAFEFRFKADEAHKGFWDVAFSCGSYLATFFQGVSLGAFVNGFAVTDNGFSGGALDWLTPFSVFTGISLLVSYALLGSTWLVMKTEGDLEKLMRRIARHIVLAVLAVVLVVSVWTPLAHRSIAIRWLSLPNLIFLSPVPFLVAASAWMIIASLRSRARFRAFVFALLMVLLAYSGFAISLWPNIVPPALSIWEAASPPESMGFALVGTLFIIPFILGYTSWSYYVFRGKVREGEGYE
jgi:cytochrome d ubiquinol oxidase subunit II